MRLESLLREHSGMKIERPPELWEADAEEALLLPLVAEMIAAAIHRGAVLHELTLSASNVEVEPSEYDEDHLFPHPGEYVALTVSGQIDLGPDDTWHPGSEAGDGVLGALAGRLTTARARFAYVRRISPYGSVTVYFTRW